MQPSKVKEYRIKNGSFHLAQRTSPLTVEELIFSAYLPVKDPDMKYLASLFEKQMVLAKIDSERFDKTRYREAQNLCDWIRKNNKWQLLIDFYNYVHRNITRGKKEVLYIYESLVMDILYHITPFGKIWYGMDEGKPLFIKDIFGTYDIRGWELTELASQKNISELQRVRYLTQLMEEDEKHRLIRVQERNVMNVICNMIGLINKENEPFIFPGTEWFDHTNVDWEVPREYKDTSFYTNLLNQRSFLLDSDGVIVQIFNGGMFKEVRFLEEFLEDGLLVLYRVTTHDNKHTMGYIDLRNSHFYSLWEHASPSSDFFAQKIEKITKSYANFVLELYCHLTCEFDRDSADIEKLINLKTPEECYKLAEGQVGIYCKIRENEEPSKHSTTRHQITQKVLHKVRPFVRKGNPSEMAIANGRKYGIVIPPGFTFVKEHVRGKAKEELLKNMKA